MDDDERHVPEWKTVVRVRVQRPALGQTPEWKTVVRVRVQRSHFASIDAHDEVIRLNNFYSRVGDAAHYGHKVTYLVVCPAFRFLQTSGDAGDFVREFARVHRCMFRHEQSHHNRKAQYTKSELDKNFGCSYIPKATYTVSMSAVAAVRAADGHLRDKTILSTGALAVFALAPKCAGSALLRLHGTEASLQGVAPRLEG